MPILYPQKFKTADSAEEKTKELKDMGLWQIPPYFTTAIYAE